MIDRPRAGCGGTAKKKSNKRRTNYSKHYYRGVARADRGKGLGMIRGLGTSKSK